MQVVALRLYAEKLTGSFSPADQTSLREQMLDAAPPLLAASLSADPAVRAAAVSVASALTTSPLLHPKAKTWRRRSWTPYAACLRRSGMRRKASRLNQSYLRIEVK